MSDDAAKKVAAAAAEVTREVVKRDPWLAFILLVGAIAMVGTVVWSVHATTSAVSGRPTTDAVLKMIEVHASHPHAGAVTREEFLTVITALKETNNRLANEVQALRERMDRFLDKRGG